MLDPGYPGIELITDPNLQPNYKFTRDLCGFMSNCSFCCYVCCCFPCAVADLHTIERPNQQGHWIIIALAALIGEVFGWASSTVMRVADNDLKHIIERIKKSIDPQHYDPKKYNQDWDEVWMFESLSFLLACLGKFILGYLAYRAVVKIGRQMKIQEPVSRNGLKCCCCFYCCHFCKICQAGMELERPEATPLLLNIQENNPCCCCSTVRCLRHGTLTRVVYPPYPNNMPPQRNYSQQQQYAQQPYIVQPPQQNQQPYMVQPPQQNYNPANYGEQHFGQQQPAIPYGQPSSTSAQPLMA